MPHTVVVSIVIGTISFLEKRNIPHFKSRVFRHFGVSQRQGWEIVRQQRNQRNLQDEPDHPDLEETHGRKRILIPDDLYTMEKPIWEYGFEARGWVSQATAKKRLKAATIALRERPTPQHWHDIRWSDEVHFSLGPKGRAVIIRKPGERHCPDCIQEAREPEPKYLKRLHAWAAIVWDFKSELYFYEVPGNTNGKMSIDSGHGTGKKNIVRDWKQHNGLRYLFNTHGSPDLSPIENAWNAVKQYIAKFPTWTEEELQSPAIEA
ncbi:hypothetical protein N657DRAFT_658058 [Parathielavia appendiculata]|uniref:Tc1-like transposase DDE domain-containing protein n=1 Tax=Parathielavia appendiculata TaxID=2587402 RepID=A0AAN6TUM6_9PEZI|nr:hypothetical protein N657DRAFT_658058 [Parathielavia appendiculata]